MYFWTPPGKPKFSPTWRMKGRGLGVFFCFHTILTQLSEDIFHVHHMCLTHISYTNCLVSLEDFHRLTWNLQITHWQEGNMIGTKPPGNYVRAANLQGCTWNATGVLLNICPKLALAVLILSMFRRSFNSLRSMQYDYSQPVPQVNLMYPQK